MQINTTSEQVLSRQLYTKVVVIYFVLRQRMAHDTTEVTQVPDSSLCKNASTHCIVHYAQSQQTA